MTLMKIHPVALRVLPALLALIGTASATLAAAADANVIDQLRFGDAASERAHGLEATSSETLVGAKGQPARRFLPLAKGDWQGGSATFHLKVRGDAPNYLSVRMWGEDVSPNQATLFCDGKQLGYRFASDIDILDQGGKYPTAPGRFHYVTHPLPKALTQGKQEIACRLRASGPIWRYAPDFAGFQKPMTVATRPFYSLIVHADKMVPLATVEGRAPTAPVRAASAVNPVLERVKARVDKEVNKIWSAKRPPNQLEIELLGKAYGAEWSRGYRAPASVAAIVAGVDRLWEQYQQDPAIAYRDPATPNPDWFGLGLLGKALKATAGEMEAQLDATVPSRDGRALTRRQALETMFADSMAWNKRHRRLYSNQSMIKDLYGIWYNNEGLIAIGSKQAATRAALLPFFYESVGLTPWTGSLNERGEPTYAAAEDDAKFSVPKDYHQTTRRGLTKEMGYVGSYGEVLDWVAEIYEATRPAPGAPGDSRIRDQAVHIAKARAYFRYPHWDADGNRAMRLETTVGWRDLYAPGDLIYGQRPSWDASPLQLAVATQDPTLLAFAHQMINDQQLAPSIEHMLDVSSLRATIGLVSVVDEYAQLQRLPTAKVRLPMSEGEPDFVFADEEDGVVAVKHGKDIIYAELYWRANYGITGLAKVHLVNAVTDRAATVALDRQEYRPSGLFYTRPNNPHINGHRFTVRYPGDGDVWTAGEKQPVAALPAGSHYLAGEDNPYAGRADYYELRYGPYLFAMNSSKDQTFDVKLPPRSGAVKELVSGKSIAVQTSTLAVKAGTTAVFYLGEDR